MQLPTQLLRCKRIRAAFTSGGNGGSGRRRVTAAPSASVSTGRRPRRLAARSESSKRMASTVASPNEVRSTSEDLESNSYSQTCQTTGQMAKWLVVAFGLFSTNKDTNFKVATVQWLKFTFPGPTYQDLFVNIAFQEVRGKYQIHP